MWNWGRNISYRCFSKGPNEILRGQLVAYYFVVDKFCWGENDNTRGTEPLGLPLATPLNPGEKIMYEWITQWSKLTAKMHRLIPSQNILWNLASVYRAIKVALQLCIWHHGKFWVIDTTYSMDQVSSCIKLCPWVTARFIILCLQIINADTIECVRR